jgi:hypothetical protein
MRAAFISAKVWIRIVSVVTVAQAAGTQDRRNWTMKLDDQTCGLE